MQETGVKMSTHHKDDDDEDPLMSPSSQLAVIVGSEPLPRTEVTKKVWAYIKKNGLQDLINKRMINADDKLRPVFGGKDQVTMFEMTKLISSNLSQTTEQELQKLNAEAEDYLSKFLKEQEKTGDKEQNKTEVNSKKISTKDLVKVALATRIAVGGAMIGSTMAIGSSVVFAGGPIGWVFASAIVGTTVFFNKKLKEKNELQIDDLFEEDSLVIKVLAPDIWLSKLAVDAYNKIDIKTYYKNAVEAINNYWKKDERKQALYHEALIKSAAIIKILQEKNARNETEIAYLRRLVDQLFGAVNQGIQREGMKNV